MKKKNLTILSIIFLMILIIGGSYAWLNITKTSTNKSVVTAGKLDLILDETNEGISMEPTVPISDEKGKSLEGYTFILRNRGRIDANYTIYLDDLPLEENEKRMPDKVVKFSLERDGVEIKSGLLPTIGYNPNRILDSGRIEKSSEYKYTLRVWMDENAGNDVQDTVFYAKLRVETEQVNAEYKHSDLEVRPGEENKVPTEDGKPASGYTYSSSDPEVLTVDDEGNIGIVGPGYTIITKTDKATGEVEKITVHVIIPIYITVGKDRMSCDLVEKYQTTCDITLPEHPVKEGYEFIGWNKDPKKDGGGKPGENYTVTKDKEEILYPIISNSNNIIIVRPGEENKIPTDPDKPGNRYTYTSSDPEVATVDDEGNIGIVGPGTTIITKIDNETNEVEKIIVNVRIPVIIHLGEEDTASCELTKKGQTSCKITLPDYETDDDHEFIGWNEDDKAHDGLKPGTEIEVKQGEDLILYPIVKKKEVILKASFVKQGDGVLSIGSDTLSCTIPAVYNAEVQDTRCDITLPSITVDKGYTAVGWNEDQNATTGSVIGSKASIDKDTTFYSISRKDEIILTATFKLNGAGSLDDEAHDVEKSCTLPEVFNTGVQEVSCDITLPVIKGSTNTPVVIGYNRSRDATESEFGEGTTTVTLNENKTYYAITKSNIKTLTATFNKNGSDSINNEEGESITRSCNIPSTYNGEPQDKGCKITSPSIQPNKNTPNVIGYSTGKDDHESSFPHKTEKEITSDVVYYAQTTNDKEIKYTATFELGTKVTGVEKKSDSCHVALSYNGVKRGTTCQIAAPKVTPTHGYKSVGFSVTSGSSTGETTLTLDKNMTFYANAVANSYTIEYYSNGSKVGSSSAKVDSALNLATISSLGATKAGHTFKGWDTNSTGTTVVYTDGKSVANLSMEEGGVVKLYAVWVDDVKPACSFGNANATYTTGSTSIDLTCTDLGVGMNSQNLATSNFTVSNGNGSITAVSTPTAVTNGYKWTLTLRGNSVGTFNIGIKAGVIKDRNNNTNNASTSGNITINGIVRTATFVRQGNGVTGIGSNSLSCTTTGSNTSCNITLPSISVSSGYTAVGWNTSNNATSGTKAGTSVALSSNPTYYVISYKNAVTRAVSWQSNGASLSGGTSSCTIPAAYNNNAQATSCNITSPTISRSGFSIVGFNTSSGGTTSGWNSNTTKAVSSNATYYAITSKTVTVSFNGNGASVGSQSQSCTIWNSATTCNITSPNITRSGYTIVGYNTSNSATSSGWNKQTSKAFSSNATYYAITSKAVTITFNANGATLSKTSASCTMYNTATSCSLTSPTITRSGYTAVGFNTSSSATTSSWNQNTAKNVSSNDTYYAITKLNINSNITGTVPECVKNKTSGSCAVGTAIQYKVNASETRTFYVLHDDGATLTMQDSENTVENVAWYSASEDNSTGPTTAIAALESATAGWSNVNTQTYTMGTTAFIGTNAYTGCNSCNSCTTNTYTWASRSAKARMITMQEANALGCCSTTHSCPSWMITGGLYWTMSANSSFSSYYPWVVLTTDGGVYSSYVDYYYTLPFTLAGVRAVVVISK